ncbi:MAG: C-GCAxxG-C-C family protein [Oscillospiraceae bacterium]|nr:C-GCAxxG-C-C family protein [Oscillospiraceae bacterium]
MTLGEYAKKYYLEENQNCAVSLLLGTSDTYNLGLTINDAQLLAGFGGGMACGNLCGALAGAVAAMGKVFLAEGETRSETLTEACRGFVKAFEEKWGTTLCAPIKEKNVKDPETRCQLTVVETGNMLQEFIDEILKKQ